MLVLPPSAEIDYFLQSLIHVGQLAFVDYKSCIDTSLRHLVEDLVKGHYFAVEGVRSKEEAEGQKGRGCQSGHGDSALLEFTRVDGVFGDNYWSIAIPHTGATGGKSVVCGDVGVSVDADCGDMQFSAHGTVVEGLNVLENMFKTPSTGVDFSSSQRVEHKGVIRVGTMAKKQGIVPHIGSHLVLRSFGVERALIYSIRGRWSNMASRLWLW